MSAADERPCIERGEHVLTQRHNRSDCPTRVSADARLTEVAVQQGWNVSTQLDLALRYIDTLARPDRPASFEDFLRGIAAEENQTDEAEDRVRLPDFTKDVRGDTFGGAYWNEADYRVIIKRTSETMFLLTVEDSSGAMAIEHEFTDEQAQGLQQAVNTDDAADDHEGLGLSRELHWRLEEDRTRVDLEVDILEEISAWLDFAFGEETYEGNPDEWEY